MIMPYTKAKNGIFVSKKMRTMQHVLCYYVHNKETQNLLAEMEISFTEANY